MEKLKEKRLEERREQKAKDEIVEQYLQQIKKDHEAEISNMNEYITELQESGPTLATSESKSRFTEQINSLRVENTDLKRKIADTENLIKSLKRESTQKSDQAASP